MVGYIHGSGDLIPMRRAVLAGVLAGAIAGLIAVALTVPLRRAVSVTDRTIINGFSVTLGAIVLWTAAGIAYAVQASRSTSAQRWLLIAAAGAAVAISAFVAADIGPLAPYPPHFASLAIPIWLMITVGGAALFPWLIRLQVSLAVAAPAALVAAVALGLVVYAKDREPAVHYSLARVPVSSNLQPAPSASPVSTAAPAATVTTTSAAESATPTVTTAPVGSMHFVVSNQSEVAYTVHEKLAKLPSPSDAIGKTKAITGDLYLLPEGLVPDKPSSFTADLSKLTSDEPVRDRFVRQSTLETSKYPTATYTVTGISGFPTSYKEGDQVKLTLTGSFKLHNVEALLTWTGTAHFAAGTLEAVASTDFDMRDYKITPPNTSIAVAQSKVHLDLHLVATVAPE